MADVGCAGVAIVGRGLAGWSPLDLLPEAFFETKRDSMKHMAINGVFVRGYERLRDVVTPQGAILSSLR